MRSEELPIQAPPPPLEATLQATPEEAPEEAPEATPEETLEETRAEAQKEATKAGQGVLFIAAAKVLFVVSSYGVQLALPRLLDSVEEFGLFATAMSVVSMINNLMVVSTIQTVSKLVSEGDERAPQTLRQGLMLQAVTGALLAGIMLLVAPALARDVFLDARLEPLLRVGAAVFFAYALYATCVGALNGQRRFKHQAGLDMTFSILRTAGLVGGAALGFGAFGVLSGFTIAAFIIMTIALFAVGTGARGEGYSLRRWMGFLVPLFLYQLFLNGVLQIDLALLKRTVAAMAVEAGQAAEAAASLASHHAGIYRAAQMFAFVPYQLILAVTFIVFPLVSRATSGADLEKTRSYIRTSLRFSYLFLLALAAPISGSASGVLRIAYPAEYLSGADALGVLVFGMVAFAMFVVSSTIVSGAGRPGVAAVIAFVGLTVVVGMNIYLVREVGLTDRVGWAAACGTTAGTVVAMLLVAAVTWRFFGAYLPLKPFLRGAAGAAVAFFVARAVPHQSFLTAVLALGAGFASYTAVLFLLRELGRAEIQALLRIVLRKK